MQRAVFLDRDGVLVDDDGLVINAAGFSICPGVPEAMHRLKKAGFLLVVVTNQAVVARGLLSEAALEELHGELQMLLVSKGAPRWDALYACPHHPNADVPAYRMACECRKPRPGMLLEAARTLSLDLRSSYMVGDRISDIAAGRAAGCKTVWVQSGAHLNGPIESSVLLDQGLSAEHACGDLQAAAHWILSQP
jgi:D-glycero-D-manno-heptose 1,7-bisphosphate phosphatase